MISEPDFRTIVQELAGLTREWTIRAQEMQEALTSNGGIHECPEFTLRMTGTSQIAELKFTTKAQRLSAAVLRSKVLKAHAELIASANAAMSQQVATIMEAPGIAQGIRSSLPTEVTDLATVEETPESSRTVSSPTRQPPTVADLEADDVLEWIEQTLGDTAELDVDELFADVPEWDPSRPLDPDNAQHEFEKEIAQAVEQGTQLAANLDRIVAEATSRTVDMVVNGAGRLVDINFHQPFNSLSIDILNHDAEVVHAQACEEASRLAIERLTESDPEADDPTVSLFSTVAEDAQKALDTE